MHHNKMIESDERYFALGNDYYRLDNYKEAAQAFSRIENYKWLYNAGNAFYKFWEESDSIDEKITFWERSIIFYTDSLENKRELKTEQNRDFVQLKLDELLELQKQQQEADLILKLKLVD